jgi:hypothetical protein
LKFSLHLSIDLNFRHTSKKIKGGSPKKILEKKNVFPKKYVELRTFDGSGKILKLAANLGRSVAQLVARLPNGSLGLNPNISEI